MAETDKTDKHGFPFGSPTSYSDPEATIITNSPKITTPIAKAIGRRQTETRNRCSPFHRRRSKIGQEVSTHV